MPQLLSIIVPIHNGVAYNRLFLESVQRYTVGPYELIVVDNGSGDGSAELFRRAGARVLRNQANPCYCCSMNQGLAAAGGELLCFANNDLWFGVHWDAPLREAIEGRGEWVTGPAGIEAAETVRARKALRRRWNRARLPLLGLGVGERRLRLALRLMYGNWEAFCRERRARLRGSLAPGIQGNCVVARRDLFRRLGPWDPRVPEADWHLYLTVARRAGSAGDVKPPRLAPDSYVHHFIRGTARGSHPPFSCVHERLSLDRVWTAEERARWGWQGLVAP